MPEHCRRCGRCCQAEASPDTWERGLADVSSGLQTWTPVSLTGAYVTSINSTWERVIVLTSDAARQMGRVTVVSRAASRNDFATGPGGAALTGSAMWTSAGIRLTDNTMGLLGAMVMESTPVAPAQTGFTASFNVTLGPSTTVVPAFSISDQGENKLTGGGSGTWL